MQPTSIRLSIPDSIDPTRLMGPADANLRRVEAAFEALVSVRGNQVLVSGSAEQVDLVTQVFSRRIRVVEAGESLGFLPGTLQEKLDPYVRPLYDALFDMTDMERGNALIEQGVIEIAPLAFMRGRTLNDAFVILDEAQNTTPEQMKMFLTRLGFGSKFVVTGDASQRDLRGSSGLDSARRVLADVEDISFVELDRNDIVRHTLVARIVDAYDRSGEA